MKEEKTLAKIAITPDADTMLNRAMERINEKSPGGRVAKVDLASWFILRAASQLTETLIEEIRMEYFNQVLYLDHLVRDAKKAGRATLNAEELERFQAITRRKDHLKKKRSAQEREAAGEVGLGSSKG